jgi:L-asparaginase
MNSSTYPAAQHVMVLYTGGTIGMQASANGLAPASGFEARMRDYLHSQPELVVPQWRFREMSPLIDSANMTPAYWQQLREAVVDAVDVQGCDSVLILHGTDTLAYSAAAMSFQLLGLHARVCFTGSMLPAGVTDSDAWENLSGALVALGQGLAPGVHLYFHGELLAPTRSSAWNAKVAASRPHRCQRS